MLNALHLTVDTIEEVHGQEIDLATIPQERGVYEMMTKADTVGLFRSSRGPRWPLCRG